MAYGTFIDRWNRPNGHNVICVHLWPDLRHLPRHPTGDRLGWSRPERKGSGIRMWSESKKPCGTNIQHIISSTLNSNLVRQHSVIEPFADWLLAVQSDSLTWKWKMGLCKDSFLYKLRILCIANPLPHSPIRPLGMSRGRRRRRHSPPGTEIRIVAKTPGDVKLLSSRETQLISAAWCSFSRFLENTAIHGFACHFGRSVVTKSCNKE